MLPRKQHQTLLFLNQCAAGYGTLTYIALATALSYIFSDTVFVFSFFTGVYGLALGLGALWGDNRPGIDEKTVERVLFSSLAGIALANPGIWGILGANETLRYMLTGRHQGQLLSIFSMGMILTIGIGMVSGARQSFSSKLIKKEHAPDSGPAIKIFTSDYFGAFAGVIVFTFILNPFLGLIRGILLSQVVMLGVIDLAFLRLFREEQPLGLKLLLLITNIYVLAAILSQNAVIRALDTISGF